MAGAAPRRSSEEDPRSSGGLQPRLQALARRPRLPRPSQLAHVQRTHLPLHPLPRHGLPARHAPRADADGQPQAGEGVVAAGRGQRVRVQLLHAHWRVAGHDAHDAADEDGQLVGRDFGAQPPDEEQGRPPAALQPAR